MKGKFLFLLPRLAALTLLIGVASLVLGLLFKVLLGVVILGLIGLGIAGIAKKIAKRHHRNGEHAVGLPGRYAAQWGQPGQTSSRNTIVPIN